MQKITLEWIEKAEGDYVTAKRESQATPPNYDAAAFHAQQAAEKYLKARLVEAHVKFAKTHDLAALLDLVLPMEPLWSHLRPALDALSSLGIEVRYPGVSADEDDAEEALQTAAEMRHLVRSSLGLAP